MQMNVLDCLEILELMLIPHFWDESVREEHSSLYKTLCDSLHNTISKMSRGHFQKPVIFSEISWCHLALKMYLKILPLDQVEDKAIAYLRYLNGSSVCDQVEMYLNLMNAIESDKVCSSTGILNTLLNILNPIVENMSQVDDFSLLKTCIHNIIMVSRKIKDDQDLLLLNDFLISLTEIIFAKENLESKLNDCYENLLKTRGNYYRKSQSVCNMMRLILKCFINKVKSESLPLSNKSIINFCSLVFTFATNVKDLSKKCDSCNNCSVNTNIYYSAKLICLTGSLARIVLSKGITLKDETLDIVFKHFSYASELVTQLKQRNCQTWKNVWNELGLLMYNIGVCLYDKNSNQCFKIWNMFLKKCLFLEQTEIVISESAINQTLGGLTEICIGKEKYLEALTYAALNVLKSSEQKLKTAFPQWVRIKSACRDSQSLINDVIQETTVVCALELKTEYSPLLDKNTKKMLLTRELEHYKKLWPSKKPMKAAYKKLFEIADVVTSAKVLVKIWGGCSDLPVIDDFMPLVYNTLQNLEKALKDPEINNLELKLCLANIYMLNYDYRFADLRHQHFDEMNSTFIAPKPSLQPHEEPPNPNDECDMVSAYSKLNMTTIQKVITDLDKSLEIFKNLKITLADVLLLDEYKVLDLLIAIADNYCLHNYNYFALQAWAVTYRIAELMENEVVKLKGINFFLEFSSSASNTKLLEKASSICSKLQENSDDFLKVLASFYIQKSYILLKEKKVEEALKNFQISKSYSEQLSFGDKTIKVELLLLEVQFLLLPCSYKIEQHEVTPLFKLHQALHLLTQFIKEKGNNPSSLYLLFKVTKCIGSMCKWTFLPREVRCYCREATTLAQKLLLSVVTSELLILLAHADLQSVRFDDCCVKLNGLFDILCLFPKRNTTPDSEGITKNNGVFNIYSEEEEEKDRYKNLVPSFEFQEQVLDVPHSRHRSKDNCGSPEFVKQSFKMPNFVTHKNSCECIFCCSLEFQDVTLQTLHLQALLNFSKQDFVTAKQFFEGALFLHKRLTLRELSIKKRLNKIAGEELFSPEKSFFWNSYCSILLDYAYFLMRVNQFSEAKKINRLLLSQLSDKELQNIYLQNEAILQESLILFETESKTDENDINLLNLNTENEDDNGEILKTTPEKTPENHKSKIIVVKSFSPHVDSPPKKVVKAIKFDFAEQDHKPKPSNNEDEFSSILSLLSKTPSPVPKIKVYVSPLKSTSKKALPLQMPEESQSKMETKEESSIGSDSVVSQSPNAYTPVVKKIVSKDGPDLRSRTKLLTSKLKSSVKKQLTENGFEDEGCHVGKTKSVVRKNLMSELSDVVTDLEGLSISSTAQCKESNVSDKPIPAKPMQKKRRGRPPKKK